MTPLENLIHDLSNKITVMLVVLRRIPIDQEGMVERLTKELNQVISLLKQAKADFNK